MNKSIYFSYDADDIAFVMNVCRYFKQARVHYWIDREFMNPDGDHRSALEVILRSGGYLLSFFSKKTCKEHDCRVQEELRFGLEIREKYDFDYHWILPVKIEECIFPDIRIHPKMSLRQVRPVNTGFTGDVGVEILNQCGYDRGVRNISLRRQLQFSMMDFSTVLSATDGFNILLMEQVAANDAAAMKKFIAAQQKGLRLLREWGDNLRTVLENGSADPE